MLYGFFSVGVWGDLLIIVGGFFETVQKCLKVSEGFCCKWRMSYFMTWQQNALKLNGWDNDASGIRFLSTEVSHDLSESHNDNTFGPGLSSLPIHGVHMNVTMRVAHYAGNRDFGPLWNKILILQDSSVVC